VGEGDAAPGRDERLRLDGFVPVAGEQELRRRLQACEDVVGEPGE
jgi:hypothetical protein